MTSSPVPPPRRVAAYVATLVVAAAAVLVAALSGADLPDAAGAAGAAAFAAAFWLFERNAVVLVWRNQRVMVAMTEVPLYLGLLLVAPADLLVGVLAARLGMALVTRRTALKTAFNAAHGVLTAAAALTVHAFLSARGVDGWLSAALATTACAVLSEALVAFLFALLEGAGFLRTYRQRFQTTTALLLAFCLPIAAATYALFRLHWAAALLALPILVLLVRYAALDARADREIRLHRRLATDGQDVIGCQDDEVIARKVMGTCQEVLHAGGVRFSLSSGRQLSISDGSIDLSSAPSLEVEVTGTDARGLGRIQVWGRPGRPPYGPDDGALLRIIGGQAAHALETAEALRTVTAQRETAVRQEKLSALGSLVAGVAHEVNNPLTYVQGNLELALMEIGDAEEALPAGSPTREALAQARQHLGTALGGSRRIGDIVRALRSVARMKSSADHEETSLNHVVANVLELMRIGLPHDVDMVFEAAPGGARVLGSTSDLHQVVLNLAKNAVEATTAEGGTVRVSVRETRDAVELLVSDDGPGISPEVRAKLFTPFFTTKGAAGTGLGLSIVHSIVKDHRGEIHVDSPPEGGAVFRIVFPRAAPVS